MGSSVRPVASTLNEAEFEQWKATQGAPTPVLDEGEFEAWKKTGDVDLRTSTPSPVRMAPVVVSRVEQPAAPMRLRPLPQALAPADASRIGAPAPNPQATRLTGAAKKASDVFQGMADNPLHTATAIPLAPLEAAGTAGRFIGQQINDATDPDATDVAASMGVPRISDRDAAIAAAQLGAVGLGPAVNRIVTRGASAAAKAAGLAGDVAKTGVVGGVGRFAPTLGAATEGAGIGAAYDPDHPVRGAAVGGLLGTVGELAPRLRVGARQAVAETDASRLLAQPNRIRSTATARVIDEAAVAQHEPDYTIENLPAHESGPVLDVAEFERWKSAQKPSEQAPTSSSTTPYKPFGPDWDAGAGEPRSAVVARERGLIDVPTEGVGPAALTARLEVLDRLAKTDPEHGERAAAVATRIRAQLEGAPPAIPAPRPTATPADIPQHRWDTFDPAAERANQEAPVATTPPPPSTSTEGTAPSTVRLYRAEGRLLDDPGAESAAPPLDLQNPADNRGQFFTTDLELARRAAKSRAGMHGGADVWHVDVPHDVAAAARTASEQRGDGWDGEHILPREWAGRSAPLEGFDAEGPHAASQPTVLPSHAAFLAQRDAGTSATDATQWEAPQEAGRKQDYSKLHPADLVELLAAEQQVLETQGTKTAAGNFSRYNESGGYPVAGGTLSGGIARQQVKHATKRIAAIEDQLRAHGVDQHTIDAVRMDPTHATETATMMREPLAGVSHGDEITDDHGRVLFAKAAGGSPKAGKRSAASPSAAPGAPAPTTAAAATTTPPGVAAPAMNRHAAAVRAIFAPTSLTPQSGQMGRIVREHAAASAHDLEAARESMKQFSRSFDRMPRAERLDFIDRVEQGGTQLTPELTKAAATMRQLLDGARDEIRALGTGKLESWIENYFPHIWADPAAAKLAVGRILGKRPLEGPKSFLKKRTIPTTKEGIAHGLDPVTDNPIDLTLLKLKEMRRYLAAHRILQESERDGLVKYLSATTKGPDGYVRINDGIGTVYGKPTVTASEAFDKQMREGLEGAITRLRGLEHSRKVSTGKRGALGFARGSDEMVSKFGTHDGVIMHELGHILDARYGLGKVLASVPGATKELQDLAALRHQTSPTATTKFKAYVQEDQERTANALHALLHAPEAMATVAPRVKARLETFLKSKPELAPILDIKPSLELGTGKAEIPVGGLVVRGHYHAPTDVARVLNHYLSPGLRGNALYDAYQGINNTLNQAQLGLSAFHLGFTSMDAAVSQVAVGLQNLSRGRIRQGLGQIASYPVAPVTTFLRGSKLLHAYLNPATASPDLVTLVDAIVAAGGRARQDSFYANEAPKKFLEALRHGPIDNRVIARGSVDARVLGAMRQAVPAILELAAKPIMEGVVPRQKLGVFMQLAERALADLPKNASRDDVRKALGRAWDSVDNRLGQLVYDNLFWDKALKDLAMASVRSVGWNIGTIRELGGGGVDLGKAAIGAAKGDPVELTERASYFIALPFAVGLAGAIMGYLLTGEPPKELRDYFFPKTGKKNIEGNDERVQLPSYMKDVTAYTRHPVQTVGHKAAPAISLISEMLHNEDYYGDQIRNPDDPYVTQMQQVTGHLAKELVPFGVRNAQESGKRVVDPRMKVAGFVGVTAAPRDATRTPAENKMMEYLAGKSMRGGTPEEATARTARADLLQAARQGTVSEQQLDDAEEKGTLTRRQRVRVQRAADGDSDLWLERYKRLDADQALAVYKLASPPEQSKYRDALETKLIKAGRDDEIEALAPVKVSSTGSTRVRTP